jgi:hypothetical protein
MEETWAISGVDLHLELRGHRVKAGLEAALREAVQTGRLAPGTRLPARRQAVTTGKIPAQGRMTRTAQRFPGKPDLASPLRPAAA